jgi:hypothetical protein
MENFMHLRSLLGRNIDKLLIFLRKKSQIINKKKIELFDCKSPILYIITYSIIKEDKRILI